MISKLFVKIYIYIYIYIKRIIKPSLGYNSRVFYSIKFASKDAFTHNYEDKPALFRGFLKIRPRKTFVKVVK